MTGHYDRLPGDLPAPVDDGAAAHLAGRALPAITLGATDGTGVDLATLRGWWVLFIYPMTGRPGVALPDGWDGIPGARGCTPQSCAFRDHHAALRALGARVLGISVQPTAEQREARARLHLPYQLLSDSGRALERAMGLPTFTVAGRTFYRRLTLITCNARVEHLFYPVFPPDRNADEVLDWLREHVGPGAQEARMDREPFETMLTGGHPNSLGRTLEVVEAVHADPDRLAELYACYRSQDEVVRLRTSSAIKRVGRATPERLDPYLDRLIGEVAELDQPSAQWTLAELFGMLATRMSEAQRAAATAVMQRNLATHRDWIVLNHTMQTLAEWAAEDDELCGWLLPHLARLERDPRKSVARRAARLRGALEPPPAGNDG